MHRSKNILISFLLNLGFAIIEFGGGLLTNSVAIQTDAIHDLGDSLSLGLSFLLEKKSERKKNDKYTFGYLRYSVMGSLITTLILISGSLLAIIEAFKRIKNPVFIHYKGMLILAIFGLIVNSLAAYFTHEGKTLNEKSISLHLLEDVLGWVIVLIGSIIMNFVNLSFIDSLMSFIVAIFILFAALKNLKVIIDLFLEKTPDNIVIKDLKEKLLAIENVSDVHHVHVWSLDGIKVMATLHVKYLKNEEEVKRKVKETLEEMGINHLTIEMEKYNEECLEKECI